MIVSFSEGEIDVLREFMLTWLSEGYLGMTTSTAERSVFKKLGLKPSDSGPYREEIEEALR